MYFLKKEEIPKTLNIGPFIVFTENSYHGIFTKKNGKIKNIGKLVSLPTKVLPKEFRKNFSFVEDVIKFLVAKKSETSYIKIYYEKENLIFEGVKFKNYLHKFKLKEENSKSIEKLLNNTQNMLKLKNVIYNIIPRQIFNLRGIIHIDLDSKTEKIPFELVENKINVLVKRIISTNKQYIHKNYFKSIAIISNNWDKKFNYCYLEGQKIFEITKRNFSSELVCNKISFEEFTKLSKENDIMFISSHATKEGIDLGDFFLNKDSMKLVPISPKIVFLNNCYFEGIEELVKHMLTNGTNLVIYSPFKIPDTKETMYFTSVFFETLSKSYDIDLSFFVALKSSKEKKYYNHLLYRICI